MLIKWHDTTVCRAKETDVVVCNLTQTSLHFCWNAKKKINYNYCLILLRFESTISCVMYPHCNSTLHQITKCGHVFCYIAVWNTVVVNPMYVIPIKVANTTLGEVGRVSQYISLTDLLPKRYSCCMYTVFVGEYWYALCGVQPLITLLH